MASILAITSLPCWPTRRADGSLKEAGAGGVEAGAVVVLLVLAAVAPAGDGVAGGLDVAVDAELGCGAAGGAGVDVEAEGVEGVAGFGAAGTVFG